MSRAALGATASGSTESSGVCNRGSVEPGGDSGRSVDEALWTDVRVDRLGQGVRIVDDIMVGRTAGNAWRAMHEDVMLGNRFAELGT